MEAYNTRFTKGALGLLERCRNDGDPSVAGGEMSVFDEAYQRIKHEIELPPYAIERIRRAKGMKLKKMDNAFTIDTHHLNHVLAEVCGLKTKMIFGTLHYVSKTWERDNMKAGRWDIWNPCKNHNQMAEVKAALREQGHKWEIHWSGEAYGVWIGTKTDYMGPVDGALTQHAESELLAFALAVEKMREKETKHE